VGRGALGRNGSGADRRYAHPRGCRVERPARHQVAVSVWVDAARDVRLARGIARDGESYRPHWERWAAQEDALFAADGTRARADLVIETSAM